MRGLSPIFLDFTGPQVAVKLIKTDPRFWIRQPSCVYPHQ
jgi:hypothetical protein